MVKSMKEGWDGSFAAPGPAPAEDLEQLRRDEVFRIAENHIRRQDAQSLGKLFQQDRSYANYRDGNNLGRTLLHVAAETSSAMVRLLRADYSLDLDQKENEFGHTPLHRAIRNNKKEVVEMLVDLGADLKVKDASGRTPLMYAEANDRQDIAIYLREHDDQRVGSAKAPPAAISPAPPVQTDPASPALTLPGRFKMRMKK